MAGKWIRDSQWEPRGDLTVSLECSVLVHPSQDTSGGSLSTSLSEPMAPVKDEASLGGREEGMRGGELYFFPGLKTQMGSWWETLTS